MLSDEQLAAIHAEALDKMGYEISEHIGRDLIALLDEHAAFKAALQSIVNDCESADAMAYEAARALRGEHA